MLLTSLPVVFWGETDRPWLRCHLAWGDLQRDHVDIATPILLPAHWRCNGHDFFFRGDKLVTGASAREVYNRAFLLIPRRCVRAGAA